MPARWIFASIFLALSAAGVTIAEAKADEHTVLLQSTTSTANSGLYDAILPVFTARTGIKVNVVAVGTGQALKNARNGDGDVLLVHAKDAEEQFVAQGWGVRRFDVMYNDFVLVGPVEDQAGVGDEADVIAALRRIASARAVFVSRGDDSGTHRRERVLWAKTGVDVDTASGTWYRETGSGMGATLNVAVGMNGYAMTDRGTWLSFKNKQSHRILLHGDRRMFNQYGIILINPDRHPWVRAKSGQAFIDWLIGREGQNAIANFRLKGQQLFFPNAR